MPFLGRWSVNSSFHPCRSEWFSSFVIASIVSLENDDERVQVINKWIEVAIETKTALGNLYGFVNIVQALCSSQVRRTSKYPSVLYMSIGPERLMSYILWVSNKHISVGTFLTTAVFIIYLYLKKQLVFSDTHITYIISTAFLPMWNMS